MSKILQDAIFKFHHWSLTIPIDSQGSDWETYYPNWDDLYHIFDNHLEHNSPHLTQKMDIEALIYAIARDNEMEELITVLARYSNWFEFLLPHIISSDEDDARWQLATVLGKNVLPFEILENALIKLFEDPVEYVRRRALESLGKIHSSYTESFCVKAWDTGHEYQRIMVLWVLKEINSSKLSTFLAKAVEDARPNILANASQIEKMISH